MEVKFAQIIPSMKSVEKNSPNNQVNKRELYRHLRPLNSISSSLILNLNNKEDLRDIITDYILQNLEIENVENGSKNKNDNENPLSSHKNGNYKRNVRKN